MHINQLTCGEIAEQYPWIIDYFEEIGLDFETAKQQTYAQYIQTLDAEWLSDQALSQEQMISDFYAYIKSMRELLGEHDGNQIQRLTILSGYNKLGEPESFDQIELLPSQIISIVGPTGSGKSRLLQDIEWTACGDTPTRRSILINDEKPDLKWRFSAHNRLVAQLSQNMNFVIDLTCEAFLDLHAESRMVENKQAVIETILQAANDLAGEPFQPDTPITALSGGQSRALMIADTAFLSQSPIILIDEIENAGIDRRKALELLVKKDKIVLMATHDPILALMADRRIVISKGGIVNILTTTNEERALLEKLETYDATLQTIRTHLRNGTELPKCHSI